jgi:hypothetical protein
LIVIINNSNQIAKRADKGGRISVEDIHEIQAGQNKIYKELRGLDGISSVLEYLQ